MPQIKPSSSYEFTVIPQQELDDLTGGTLDTGTRFSLDGAGAMIVTIGDSDMHLDAQGSRTTDPSQPLTVAGHDAGPALGGTLLRLRSPDGTRYELVEIRTDLGSYWTFVGGIPPAGESLSIGHVFHDRKVKYMDGLGVTPLLAAADTLGTDEDSPTTGNLLANDRIGVTNVHPSGKQDAALRIVHVEGGVLGAAFEATSASGGRAMATIGADGTVTVDPAGGFEHLALGETDRLTIRYLAEATVPGYGRPGAGKELVGQDTGEVTIVIEGVNDTPVALDDGYQTAAGTGAMQVHAADGVLANDRDVDGDALTAELIAGPANGDLVLAADGSFTYTPSALFAGTAEFTYRVKDPHGAVAQATATVSVAPGAAPLAQNHAATEDTRLVVGADAGVLANAPRVAGDPLVATLLDGPLHGALSLHEDGSFDYLPDENAHGQDTFVYRVTDKAGLSIIREAVIDVAPVNDAPEIEMLRKLAVAGQHAVGFAAATLLASDADGDALSFRLADGDTFLFDLVDRDGDPQTPLVDLIVRGTDALGNRLFPHGEQSVRALAGDDLAFEVTVIVSDGTSSDELTLTFAALSSS